MPKTRALKPLTPLEALHNAEHLHRIGALSQPELLKVRERIQRTLGGSEHVSTVSKAGGTTIPAAIREGLGLEAGTRIEWAPGDGYAIVRIAQTRQA